MPAPKSRLHSAPGTPTTTKNTFEDLAIAGGRPAFETPLHVGRPNIGNRRRLLERIENILDSRWLTNGGPFVEGFEASVRERLGVEHAVATCNGTVALAVAMKAMDLRGEVIMPSFTFVAAAHAAHWLGITPVFCDVDPDTHNLDPSRIQSLITDRTTGIIPTHLWGRPCDVDAIQAIADRHGLRVLYDASHAFSCSRSGVMLGNFGDAEVFSFHATKFVNAFEGGVVATNSSQLADRLRLMRNFGFAGPDSVVESGINGKMSEVSAAMGITSLESLDYFIFINERNYREYRKALSGVDGITLTAFDEAKRNNFQYVVLQVDEMRAGLTRDELIATLHAEGVLARRYFSPGNHRMEPYRSLMPEIDRRLPATQNLSATILCLPTGTAVSTDDILCVSDIIRIAVEHASTVRSAVGRSLIHDEP